MSANIDRARTYIRRPILASFSRSAVERQANRSEIEVESSCNHHIRQEGVTTTLDVSSAKTSRNDWFALSYCHDSTTVTQYSLVSQHRLWHRYSVSCVWQHESCLTSSHVTTSVLLCENYIGCQLVNESCLSCVFSSTVHHLDSRQTTSQTYTSQSLPFHPGPHCGTPVAETMSCQRRTGKWRIEHFPLLHRERGTNCRLN